ncbi:hypothetical protein DRQ33_02975, partial [bacterium]
MWYEYSRNGEFCFSSDDSFIFATYAKNFVSGNLFQFNVGELSWGTTSTLWTFFTISTFIIGILATKYMGLVFLAILGFLVFIILFRSPVGFFTAILAGITIIISGLSLFNALSGMDTVFFALFFLLSLYLYIHHRDSPIFYLLIFLSVFARPEGAIIPIICFLNSALERKFGQASLI